MLIDVRARGERTEPDRLPEPKFYHPHPYGQRSTSSSGRVAEPSIPISHGPPITSVERSTFGPTACASSTQATVPVSIPPTIPEAHAPERGTGPIAQCARGALHEPLLAPEPRPAPTFPCQISYDSRTVPTELGRHDRMMPASARVLDLFQSLKASLPQSPSHLQLRYLSHLETGPCRAGRLRCLSMGFALPLLCHSSVHATSRPDTFQCERFPLHRRRSCVVCKFACCSEWCREPMRICSVRTGAPATPNDQSGGPPRGDGSLSDAKKDKCKSFRLEPEPEPGFGDGLLK